MSLLATHAVAHWLAQQKTRTDVETSARLTADQKHVYFIRQNSLYVIELNGGSLVQEVDIRTRLSALCGEGTT